MPKIIIHGSKGRMGQALLACVCNHPEIQIVGQVDVGDQIEDILGQTDVVVDFSSYQATPDLVEWCAGAGKAMVIGTTGHSVDVRTKISELANTIPIVMTSNFSVGVNTLFCLAREAAEFLGPDFDIEIVEMHHRLKRDAPSGTARTLYEILSKVRDRQFAEKPYARQRGMMAYSKPGRLGNTGMRDCNEIGLHAVRGGDVVGEHTVIFASNGERVEFVHKASSRETFANGALLAAQWVVKQTPGLYSMEHVLGLVKAA